MQKSVFSSPKKSGSQGWQTLKVSPLTSTGRNETAQKYGMNSKETIQCSQELDILLNTRIKEEMIFGRYLENSRM